MLSRIATSTPSLAKSASFMLAETRASISGCACRKRHSRGISHLAMSPGVALITRTLASRRAIELPDRVAHALEARMQARIDQPAGVGQLDRAGAAVEQREAELLLQRADLVAERGRRHVQLLGRLGEAQVAGDRLEGAQRIERRQRLRS